MKQSRIIQGLMRVPNISDEAFLNLIEFDLKHGINFFDIADIYGGGESERKVGRILKSHPEIREKMFIQSKVSIRNDGRGGYYDMSYDHIKEGVDGILERMNLQYLDALLLHRPDVLMDAEEIAKAFNELEKEGKVKHFGVSNFSASMIDYLATEVKQPLEYNQIQVGLGQMRIVEETFNFNMNNNEGASRTEGTFFYMKKKGMMIQAWSPFMVGYFEGNLFDEGRYPELNAALSEIANKYQTSKCAVATAFILKLDKNMRVITGSANPAHVQECLDGEALNLAKEDWYFLYRASGHQLP